MEPSPTIGEVVISRKSLSEKSLQQRDIGKSLVTRNFYQLSITGKSGGLYQWEELTYREVFTRGKSLSGESLHQREIFLSESSISSGSRHQR